MEAQARDLKNHYFTEEYCRQLKAESKSVVVLDKAGVVDTMEEVVMMLEMWWNHVSHFFSGFGFGS